MKTYNSYHTCIKQLARSNALPEKYTSFIDRSTIWRWKHESEDKYLGNELSNIQVLQQFLERQESARVIKSYLKIAMALSGIFRKANQLRRILNQEKNILVNVLHNCRSKIDIKIVLKLLKLSSSTYYHWKNQIQYPCKSSALSLCRRLYPNQLTEKETNQIKTLAMDQRFKYWPVSSIFHYARRNKLVHISLSSWYAYIHKLGISRPMIPRKSISRTGIRASSAHQVWHADITIVKCLNGMKYYVYLLMDNYSRFILNYQVSTRVLAKIRLDSIREAHEEYIDKLDMDTLLMVDGGPENNNHLMDHYTNSEGVSLRKVIAGKDIHFSNSMVEAQNKIIKYYYLFKHPFSSLQELNKMLDWIIKDYNHARPHHSLGGLTPFEALKGEISPKLENKIQLRHAREMRIRENSEKSCGVC